MAQDIIERYRDLPAGYGKDIIVLLGQRPGTMFAYWEVTPAGTEGARSRLGEGGRDASLAVRLLDGSGSVVQEHGVGDGIGRFYFHGVPQGLPIKAQIGLRSPDGRFVAVATSNQVISYRAGQAPAGPVVWARAITTPEGRRRLVPEGGAGPERPAVDTEAIRERVPVGVFSRLPEKK